MEWLAVLLIVVYLIVVVGARFPLLRQWTMWAGVARSGSPRISETR